MTRSDEMKIPYTASAFSETEIADVESVLQFMRPKPCPFPMIRVGGSGDGAYLLPEDLGEIEACFSPGVNNFKYFEDSLLEEYAIASHMCDRSSDVDRFTTPLVKGKQTFRKLWLDTTGGDDAISLDDWVAELAPGNGDLVLQIDIEGAEYRNILNADPATLHRFRIIVIELHGLGRLNNPGSFRRVIGPFFDKLAVDFICVHAHPNNASTQVPVRHTQTHVPNILELTLLRKDRFEGKAAHDFIAPQLPHPLDVDCNVAKNPPAFLDSTWLDGPQSQDSMLKQARDELKYWKRHGAQVTDPKQQPSAMLAWIFAAISRARDLPRAGIAQDTSAQVDLAKGKPFQINSVYGKHAREGKIEKREPFFFHTATDRIGPAITVDLQAEARVSEIFIANRTSGFFQRASNLVAVFHHDHDPKTGVAFPVNPDAAFLNGDVVETCLEVPQVPARYVTVISPIQTALHFSDLRIMGRVAS